MLADFRREILSRLLGLKSGMHRLTAEVSHPENGDIIVGSGVGMRRFWVTEKDKGLVTMKLSPAGEDAGSTAIPGSIKSDSVDEFDYGLAHKAQVVVQITVDGSMHSLPIYDGDDFHMEAARFCRATNIVTEGCVETIAAKIQEQWDSRSSDIELEAQG